VNPFSAEEFAKMFDYVPVSWDEGPMFRWLAEQHCQVGLWFDPFFQKSGPYMAEVIWPEESGTLGEEPPEHGTSGAHALGLAIIAAVERRQQKGGESDEEAV